jgi:hypothetical protein
MFAAKLTGRAPRNRRLLMSLAGLLALITIYWALPSVIAEFLQFRLALAGFTRIDIKARRPSWDELLIDSIQASRRSGNRLLTVRAAGMRIRYRPLELLSGRLTSIRIEKTDIESRLIETERPMDDTGDEPMPIAFATGRWLSGLPADELSLERLDLDFRTPNGGVYAARAAALVQNGTATLSGEIRPAEEPPFTFSAHADANGEFALDVRASGDAAPPVLNIAARSGEITNGRMSVDGELRGNLDGIAGLLKPWLEPGRELPPVKGHIDSRWRGAVPVAGRAFEDLAINSDHDLRIKAEPSDGAIRSVESSVRVSASIAEHQIRWRIEEQSTLSARFKGTSKAHPKPPVAVTLPKGMAGSVEIVPEGLVFDVAAGSIVHLSPIEWNGISLSELDIALTGSTKLRYDSKLARWNFEPFELLIKPAILRWTSGEIQIDPASFKISALTGGNAGWEGMGELHSRSVKPIVQGQALPTGEVSIKFQGDSKQLDFESVAALSEGKLLLTGRARHRLSSGRGSAYFDLAPVVFGESGLTLKQLLEPWPYPVDLHAGRIHVHGSGSWKFSAGDGSRETLRFRDKVTVGAEGLAGRLKAINFKGLDAHLVLSNGLRTLDPARISIERFDSGVPITGLSAEGSVTAHGDGSGYSVDLHRFDTNLLGGTVHAGPARLDTARPSSPIILNLRGLSLGQIIALETQQGVEGSGILDGRLPLQITKTHVAIRAGELQARPPGGWIRYRPTEGVKVLAEDNVGLQFVNQALSNLQYKTLKIKADSTSKGDLDLRVELRGHNPDWQADRPIHLNLNIQENIPMLLRSLSIADDLTERVTRQVEKGYRKKH